MATNTSHVDIDQTSFVSHAEPNPRGQAAGWLLAAWSFAFACVHFAWALGWEGWLPADVGPIFDRPWFLAYDLAAGLLMVTAAPVAVAIGHGKAPRLLRRTTLVAAVLALLRGVPALVFDVATTEYTGVSFGADVWFVVAGIGGLVLLGLTRTDARSRS
ncbi:hypothetical protein ABTZ46_17680 [Nocardioides sp. NPDC126508]